MFFHYLCNLIYVHAPIAHIWEESGNEFSESDFMLGQWGKRVTQHYLRSEKFSRRIRNVDVETLEMMAESGEKL